MPWKASDAAGKTKHADTPERQAKWAKVANRVLADTGDEGRAIKIANAAVDGKAKRNRNAARRRISMKAEMRDRMKSHRKGDEHYSDMDEFDEAV